MLDYQQRVVNEKANLDKLIADLESFLQSDRFRDIKNDYEKERISRQRGIMIAYSNSLNERITHF
jgi:hypothetical protein